VGPADALLAALEPARGETREVEVLAAAARSARHGMRSGVPLGVDVLVLAAREAAIPEAAPDPAVAPAPEVPAPARARAIRRAFAGHADPTGRAVVALAGAGAGPALLLGAPSPALCELRADEALCAPLPDGVDAGAVTIVPPGASPPVPRLLRVARTQGGAVLAPPTGEPADARAVAETVSGALALRDGVAVVSARTATGFTVRYGPLPEATPTAGSAGRPAGEAPVGGRTARDGAARDPRPSPAWRELTLPSRRPALPEPTLAGGLVFAGRLEGARPVLDAQWLPESAAAAPGPRFVVRLRQVPSEHHACATSEVRAVAFVHAGAPTEESEVDLVFAAPDARPLAAVSARTTGAGFVLTCDGRRATLVGRIPRGDSAQQGYTITRLDCTPDGCASPVTVTLERLWDLPDALAIGDDLAVVYAMGPSGGLLLRRGPPDALAAAPARVLVDTMDFGGARVEARRVAVDGDDLLVAVESTAGLAVLRVRPGGEVVLVRRTGS
jgi:hypothetical protein